MKGCLIKLGKFALLLFGILVVLAIIGLLNQKPTQKKPAQPVAVVSGPTATSAVALVVNTSAPLRLKLARRGYYWRGWLHFRTGSVYGWHLTPKALTALGIKWEAEQK